MSRPAFKLAARVYVRPLARPLLDIDAAKSSAAHWNPSLRLESFRDDDTHPGGRGEKDFVLKMKTFSAFDPAAMRPLLVSGGFVSGRMPFFEKGG